MKKLFTLLNSLLIFCCGLSAQSSVWKVEGNGTTLYLGGTVHLLRAEDYPLPREFDYAYEQSQTIVLETDLSSLEDPSTAQELFKRATYKNGETLSGSLNKKVYAALEKEAAKMGLNIKGMEQFKPSIIIMTMSVFKIQQMGIDSTGVDKHYSAKAVIEDKTMDFLESKEAQIDMLANMGEGNENEFVMHSLKDFEDMEKGMKDLLSDWKSGSDKVMNKQIKSMQKEYPAIYKTLLADRNAAWMPKIELFLKNDTVEYILVGAMHLHGKDGLLALLKSKGYQISQVIQ